MRFLKSLTITKISGKNKDPENIVKMKKQIGATNFIKAGALKC